MSQSYRNIEGDINRFDDVFHQYDDDDNIDGKEDSNIDIDAFFMNMGNDNNEDIIEIEQFNDDKDKMIDLIVEEEHLSQKLSQLSASGKDQQQNENDNQSKLSTVKKRPSLTPTTTIAATTTKKMKPNEGDQSSDMIPKYLSNNNKAFEQMINPLLQKAANSINIELLREIAVLIHQLECINIDRSLWTTYLRSGTSTLKPQATTKLFLWSIEVKQRMIDCGEATTSNPDEIDQDSCLSYVNRVLEKFQNQTNYCQTQLRERKQRLNNSWTSEIEEAITKFVQQYVTAVYKLPKEGQMVAVEYDYSDRLLQLEYYQENPNEYQAIIFQDLFQLKSAKETSKLDVAILKQRITYNHLPLSFDTLQIPAPKSLNTIDDRSLRQRLTDRYEKILQQTKSDMMMVYIATAEAKMNENEKKFDAIMVKMKRNQNSDLPDYKLTQTISDGQELDWIDRRSIFIQKSNITCSPTIIQDAPHHLSIEHIRFLNRGPTYIPPGQIHILSKSSLTLAEMITKQMAPLRRELTKLFTKYPVDLSRRMNFEKLIEQLFNESFLQSMPSILEERALYEKQLIQSIQYYLKKDQLMLRRTADNMNTYYLGRLDEFNEKSNDYIQNSTCYELIGTIDEIHTEQQHLNEIILSINSQLEILYERKLINRDHLTQWNIDKKSTINLPYLYFLPETNEDVHISVQPRLTSYRHCPIYILATYLDQLLRPLFNSFSRSTTCLNGFDFMQKLKHYYFTQSHPF
ncbi:unnamed protein product [Rotaria sp. Silwood2]|nr:unnamed protein product [Rotaria sp. Silwood2]